MRAVHIVNAIILVPCALLLVKATEQGSFLAASGWVCAIVFHVGHWVDDAIQASREA